MNITRGKTSFVHSDRQGYVLLLTLVVLIVLTTAIYAISEKMATYTHRQQYIIDYQKSRYACDSGMKYALATIKSTTIKITVRKDESKLYDFSDVFHLNKEEFEDLKFQMATLQAQDQEENKGKDEINKDDKNNVEKKTPAAKSKSNGPAEPDPLMEAMKGMMAALGEPGYGDDQEEYFDPNAIKIPGPYGPQWPYVVEPAEFEIGETTVSIIVEDENAKMPITWAMTKDPKLLRQTQDGLINFCEWMQMSQEDAELLIEQINEVADQKRFVLNRKGVTTTTTTRKPTSTAKRPTTRGRTVSRRTSTRSTTTKKTRPQLAHKTDYARLIQGSIIDLEKLARPLPDTGSRIETPLKYLALWGSEKVNINTAPRHVLEAAFAFGGDYLEIAEEIIQRRRVKPFKSVTELKTEFWRYTDSIEKVVPYLSTQSTFFTIKVTATSGKAKASAIAAVTKAGNKVEKIVMISDF